MKVDYFYIIHRKQDTNRMENVKKIIELTPCSNYEIVNEDSDLWTGVDRCLRETLICMWSKKIVKPIVSLYWNHMNIIRDIYKRKLQNVIVYEDDTNITSDFNLEIDLSKIYVNLNTGYYIYKTGEKQITMDKYIELGRPDDYKVKMLSTNALYYPNQDGSIKEFLDNMDDYRKKKKNRVRPIDMEIDRMIKKYKLQDKIVAYSNIGFSHNFDFVSTLGNNQYNNFLKKV